MLTGAEVIALRADGVLRASPSDGPTAIASCRCRASSPTSGGADPPTWSRADGGRGGRLVTEDGVRTAVPTVLVAGDARAGAGQTLPAAVADGVAAGEAAVAAPGRRPAGACGSWIPTFGVRPDESDVGVQAGGTADWTEVALFSNSKPNATELLRGVGSGCRRTGTCPRWGSPASPTPRPRPTRT